RRRPRLTQRHRQLSSAPRTQPLLRVQRQHRCADDDPRTSKSSMKNCLSTTSTSSRTRHRRSRRRLPEQLLRLHDGREHGPRHRRHQRLAPRRPELPRRVLR
ncbi:MAG: hypothetical protein MZU79_01440, partial [Anaerotruncus sp.]|nr:hypothetical protein [Anaerotruncus sp.]